MAAPNKNSLTQIVHQVVMDSDLPINSFGVLDALGMERTVKNRKKINRALNHASGASYSKISKIGVGLYVEGGYLGFDSIQGEVSRVLTGSDGLTTKDLVRMTGFTRYQINTAVRGLRLSGKLKIKSIPIGGNRVMYKVEK